ncbi:MAG: DUF6240 domain-containing protein [Acetivibrio sp.]
MNIANIQEKNNKEDLLVKQKATDENKVKTKEIQEEKKAEPAAVVSKGEEVKDAGLYNGVSEKEKKDKVTEEEEINTESSEDSTENILENTLEKTVAQMSEVDCEEFMKEGISLESFCAGRLERALLRIKENWTFRQDNIEQRVANKEEMEIIIQKIAIGNKITNPMAKEIAQKLAEADLPVTEENIMSLFGGLEMAKTVGQMSEGAKIYMLRKNLAPTIENIYQSQYSGAARTQKGEGFDQIKKQAESVIEASGMKVTEETIGKAKWLYQNQLPITKENLLSLQSLENVAENTGEDFITEKMTKAMTKGLEPEKANLDISNEKKVETAKKGYNELFESLLGREDAGSITAKRQLEEIRLKLTTEAGIRLLSKGIRLDTGDLQSVVDGLKELEREYYKGILKEGGAAPTEENADLLQSTTEKIESLKKTPNYILGKTLKQREIQTVGTLHEAASSMQVSMDKAGKTYEALMTVPRSDMGDSIKKAFRNIPAILEDMGMETNETNQRAVRILAYNQMDITKEAMQDVKAYDSQVNTLLKELKPSITVELIKRDISPLDTNIQELTNQVKEIGKEMGSTDEEKYSKYLWQLEKNGAISETERSSYIGIYRLLHNVEKTDGAAIGAVLHNNMDLTLKNLLTAVRSKKASGSDITVNDDFGNLESVTFSKENITSQIEAGFSGENMDNQKESGSQQEKIYYQEVLERILNEISPDKLNQITKDEKNNLINMTLENLQNNLEQVNENNRENREYASYITEKLRETLKMETSGVSFLEGFQMEPTIKNIVSANTFFTENKSFFKEFNKKADKEYTELIKSMPDALEDASTMQEKYQQVEQKVKELLNEEYESKAETDTSEKVEKLHLFSNGIELARRLSRQEYYEIPIVNGEEITNMNLTVVKGTKDSGRIQIQMNSEVYGKLEGEFQVKEQTIKGFILCDTKDGLETMKKTKERIVKGLEELGLEVKQIDLGYDKKAAENRSRYPQDKEETGIALLYKVAKVLVLNIGSGIQHE